MIDLPAALVADNAVEDALLSGKVTVELLAGETQVTTSVLTVILKLLSLSCSWPSVALITKLLVVAPALAILVPDIKPVLVFNEEPEGNEPEYNA